MPKPEQPASWRPFIKPPAQAKEKEEPPLDLTPAPRLFSNASPLSLPTHRPRPRSRPGAGRNSTDLPSRSPQAQSRYTSATVKFYLSRYRDSIRAVQPDHLVFAQGRRAPASASAILRCNTRRGVSRSGARKGYSRRWKRSPAPAVTCLIYEGLSEWYLGAIEACNATMAEAISVREGTE